jgi:cytosine/adenosine deaminase-related metal-dependent hydrolase
MDNAMMWVRTAGLLLVLLALSPMTTAIAQDTETKAFVNVNVIPMDTERVLEEQTVIVQGDRILEIGPVGTVSVPSGAQVIEGNGGFLIPGLTDTHVHLLDNQDALTLYLANGVTTIRDPNSNYVGTGPAILNAREQIATGKMLGPTITAAKSFISLPPQFTNAFSNLDLAVGPWLAMNRTLFELSSDPTTARELVLQAHDEGYDIVKVNWYLSRETFDSIASTADELGMPIVAHVPADVGIEHLIRSGGEIQHNQNLIAYVAKDYERQPGVNYLDKFDLSEADQKLPQLAALMAESGVAFTPTMIVDAIAFELFDNLPDWSQASIWQRPEYRYVPHSYLRTWTDPTGGEFGVVARARGASNIEEIVPAAEDRQEILSYHLRQLKALVDAGVPVMTGTDASAIGIVWGFSIHDELELFVDAGLTPYKALEASTRIPSEVMGDPGEWGTIEVGKRADLVLLRANPLEEISNTREIDGVIVRGRWLPRADLQGMLDELAATYEAAGIIELVPYTNESMAISGVVPDGWQELAPGVNARSDPSSDPTVLVQRTAPNESADELIAGTLGEFGAEGLPSEPMDSFESGDLSWAIYMVQTQSILATAVAETDSTTYLVVLSMAPSEADALVETVFFPVLGSLAPVE